MSQETEIETVADDELHDAVVAAAEDVTDFLLPHVAAIGRTGFSPEYRPEESALADAVKFPFQRIFLPFLRKGTDVAVFSEIMQTTYHQDGDAIVSVLDDGTHVRHEDEQSLLDDLLRTFAESISFAWVGQLTASMYRHGKPGRLGLAAEVINGHMLSQELYFFEGSLAADDMRVDVALAVLQAARATLPSGQVLPDRLTREFLLDPSCLLM